MKKKPKYILLVAKPWKGGLSKYLYSALSRRMEGRTEFISTYPETFLDYLSYKRDKIGWHEKLLNKINAAKYDAAIFINSLEIFSQLKQKEKNILWLTDNARISESEQNQFYSVYLSDLGHVSNLPITKNFAASLPFAYDTLLHSPIKNTAKRLCCSIINQDKNRNEWLAKFYSAERMPDIYGNYFLKNKLFWKSPNKFFNSVVNEDMASIYARYNFSINVHATVVKEGTNMRTFECAGYEIPQLIEMKPGIEKLFEPEKEFLGFTSLDSYITQFDRLTHDSRLRESLARNAKKRALAEHKYDHRIDKIFTDFIK